MKLFEQSLINDNSFCETDNLEKATHYRDGDGEISPMTQEVRELVQNMQNETALEMPAMNFDKSKKDKSKGVAVVNIENNSSEKPLEMPAMKF